MDLGCLRLGLRLSVLDKHSTEIAVDSQTQERDIRETAASASKTGKAHLPLPYSFSNYSYLLTIFPVLVRLNCKPAISRNSVCTSFISSESIQILLAPLLV